jgi:3-deoxy-D-manno-octulosonic-acid transferase
MIFLYNILITLYFILTLPYYAVQMARHNRYRAGLKQRLGFYPRSVGERPKRGGRIWFHAVSVGEVLAVMPLVQRVRAEMPGVQIVLSTVTLTGQGLAREKLGDGGTVIYFPLDMNFAVRRAIQTVTPALIVIVETEIWPNFICAASAKGIPIAIVNGRISDRSFPRYRSGRFLLKRLLDKVSVFGMQTDLDAQRIQAIGAHPEKIVATGNMKFDCGIVPGDDRAGHAIASSLGLDPGQDVIVAGSTHKGEEEIVLDAYRAVRDSGFDPVLIVAPRRPERAAEVKALLEARGERCVLRSGMVLGKSLPSGAALVIDTIGELVNVYRIATVVFVGKSLVGGGGQNVIEPASMGKAVVFGPSMHNFREAAETLLGNEAAIQVGDGRELCEALVRLFKDREAREGMGRRAAESMARSRGATQRNLEIIKELLRSSPQRR